MFRIVIDTGLMFDYIVFKPSDMVRFWCN